MDDIAPALLKNIQDTFEGLVKNDEALSRIWKRLESGKASYADAQDYAGRIAKCLQQAYSSHLSVDSLPDGRMYYNIANRVLPPTLNRCGGLVSDYCVQVQESINKAAHIGIKAQTAELNSDRIEGLVDRVSEDDFEKTQWVLKAPVDNFCRSVVDDHVKANADFHYKSGLNPRIIRKTDGHCCKWCSSRAGTYPYRADMDREVFRRHENCCCTVEYDPGNGSAQRQDVWNKRWKEGKDSRQMMSSSGMKHPLDIQFFAGKERADKFSEGWSEADLDEIIQKFAPNAIVTETEQKINYQNPNSPFIVVVDKSGDYFRIMNTSMPGKKTNLNM